MLDIDGEANVDGQQGLYEIDDDNPDSPEARDSSGDGNPQDPED